jgi:hypothetical protein
MIEKLHLVPGQKWLRSLTGRVMSLQHRTASGSDRIEHSTTKRASIRKDESSIRSLSSRSLLSVRNLISDFSNRTSLLRSLPSLTKAFPFDVGTIESRAVATRSNIQLTVLGLPGVSVGSCCYRSRFDKQ